MYFTADKAYLQMTQFNALFALCIPGRHPEFTLFSFQFMDDV